MCSSGALVSGAAIFHFSLGVLGVVCCGSADGAVLLLSWSLGCCFVLLLSPLIPWLGSWAASSLVCYCVFLVVLFWLLSPLYILLLFIC